MDFRLTVFYTAAQKLNFTTAAKELNISQPAVSKHIHELEETLHVRLFERNKNMLSLTREGELVYKYAEKILTLYHELEFEIGVQKQKLTGSLKIGASTTIAQYILPPVLGRFISKFPSVTPVLLNGNSAEIEEAVISKKVDIGLVEGATHHRRLKYIPFLQDELVAVVSVNHKAFSKIDELSLAELKHIPLVMREHGSGTLEIIENALAGKRIKLHDLKILVNLGSTESIKLFLQHNECIGFVSIRSVSSEIAEGKFKIIEIPELNLERQLHFVHRQGTPGGLASAFIKFTKGYYQKL